VRVSISVTNFTWSADAADLAHHLTAVAVAADESALDTLWVNDHLLQADPGAAPGERDMLEAYTVLGFLASATGRVRLGSLVSPVTYREPAVLLKAATTLDVLSGGRAWLGVGVGYPVEAEAMGLPMPPTVERFERLGELLELHEQQTRGDASPFEGHHYRLANPENRPLPVQRGGVPVLVGGMGPRRTLRLVARYARACNLFDVPDEGETVRRRLDVLRRHCADLGTDYEAIDTTISTRWHPDEGVDSVVERLERMRTWGLRHAIFIRPGAWTPDSVAVLAEAAARVGEL
jgi:alkanesulfonate monooxygenase SsuD/methylene tetrahydromethanopterin reductase-like flavin-dependent oxidoreductase (luciferase family)